MATATDSASGAPEGRRESRRRSTAVVLAVVVILVGVAVVLAWSPGQGRGVAGAPRGLRVQAATGASIQATWDLARSASSYQVRVTPARGGAPVVTARAWTNSIVLPGLTVGAAYRVTVAPTNAQSKASVSALVTVEPDQAPGPPVRVDATQMAATNSLQVSWVLATSGVAATGAVVRLYQGSADWASVTCEASCTTATFWDLPYGFTYRVLVETTNAGGRGLSAWSGPVPLANPCHQAGSCVSIDATAGARKAKPSAAGFLDSLYPVGNSVKLANALHPVMWRGSPTYNPTTRTLDWSSWDAAAATGAKTTMLLSNLWNGETTAGAGARTPWSDWGAYASWVTATVRKIESSGHRVDYWEIQNEPGAPGYYTAAGWATSTVADFLQQFLVAYRAIKAADRDAAIIGPSLSAFADYPGEFDRRQPDLVTFLNFAAANGLRLAAVTWHEIGESLGPQPRDSANLPEIIEDHVAEARALIAARPALGHPQVWVNEYGRPTNYEIPGWTLGDLAALEAAGVDRSGRSCWPEVVPGSPPFDDCSAPTLDGLLADNGTVPRADYWVYATYTHLTGTVVATASSDATIPVVAARTSDARVVAMIGRDVGCLPAANEICAAAQAAGTAAAAPVASANAPVPVSVGVRLPWAASTAKVAVSVIDPSWLPVTAPRQVVSGSRTVVGGLLDLSLPAVADGQVYLVSITRP